MAIKVYECTALTGGGTNALDAVPWTDLNDGDLAFVTASSKSYVFRFAAASSASEFVSSHPYTIKPDDAGANNGRWLEYVPEVPKANVPDLETISATPGSNVIPLGGAGGTLDPGWIPSGVDAGYLDGVEVSAAGPASGQALVYSEAVSAWIADDVSGSTPDASESVKGIAELATTSEAKAGEDDTRIITPAKLAAVIDELGLGRNVLINGALNIWQRGTSGFSGTVYGADRWKGGVAGQSIERSTDVPTNGKSKYSLQVTHTTEVSILQRVEASVAKGMIGRPVSLSFNADLVSGDASVDLKARISSADAEDNFSAVTSRHDATIQASMAGAWTAYELNIAALDANCANGFQVELYTSGIGESTVIRFAQVQLELGSHATEFEVPQPGHELNLCRRYYQVFGEYSAFRMTNYGTNDIRFVISIVPMRSNPSITIMGTPNTDIAVYTVDRGSTTGFTFSATSSRREDHIDIQADKTSHGLADAYLIILTTSGKIIGDAEL